MTDKDWIDFFFCAGCGVVFTLITLKLMGQI